MIDIIFPEKKTWIPANFIDPHTKETEAKTLVLSNWVINCLNFADSMIGYYCTATSVARLCPKLTIVLKGYYKSNLLVGRRRFHLFQPFRSSYLL